MQHYTKIQDTQMIIEIGSFDKHLHGEYAKTNKLTGELIKPFRFAYIDLITNNWVDKLHVFVNIYMVDNITPELNFSVVWYNKLECSLSESYINELLRDLSQEIKYNEVVWLNHIPYPGDKPKTQTAGIPINPLSANYS